MSKIIGIDLEDLKDEIRVAVRNEIETCIQDCRFGTEFMDEVWDRKQVADFLNTTPENVSTGFKNKEIPGRKIGREYRFLKSQIVGMFKKKAA
jgi:hypothetical protein